MSDIRQPGNPAESQTLKEPGEKERRVYYQTIVYDVCDCLDRIFCKSPAAGAVCGRADEPSRQVQELMREVEARCVEWARMKAMNQTGDQPKEIDRGQ